MRGCRCARVPVHGRVHASAITIDANIISNRLLNYDVDFINSPIELDLILTNYDLH